MPGAVNSYTREVLEQTCPKCGRGERSRCVGRVGSTKIVVAHSARLALVGLRWNPAKQELEKRS